jgi:hypothetical protein
MPETVSRTGVLAIIQVERALALEKLPVITIFPPYSTSSNITRLIQPVPEFRERVHVVFLLRREKQLLIPPLRAK